MRPAAPSSNLALSLANDSHGKVLLADMILSAFEGLKTYGKDAEQIQSIVKLFMMTLADYDIERITAAFKMHCRISDEMPTPAEIIQLIERKNKPPLQKAVYQDLLRKEASMRTPEEWAYIRDYNRFAMTGQF